MATDTSGIVSWGGYNILAFQDEAGYRARIRRPDGKRFTFGTAQSDYFDTLIYKYMDEAIDQAKLIVDSGSLG